MKGEFNVIAFMVTILLISQKLVLTTLDGDAWFRPTMSWDSIFNTRVA